MKNKGSIGSKMNERVNQSIIPLVATRGIWPAFCRVLIFLSRTPQVLNTFFKRQLLNAEHGTLGTVFQLLQVFSPLHCVKGAVQ